VDLVWPEVLPAGGTLLQRLGHLLQTGLAEDVPASNMCLCCSTPVTCAMSLGSGIQGRNVDGERTRHSFCRFASAMLYGSVMIRTISLHLHVEGIEVAHPQGPHAGSLSSSRHTAHGFCGSGDGGCICAIATAAGTGRFATSHALPCESQSDGVHAAKAGGHGRHRPPQAVIRCIDWLETMTAVLSTGRPAFNLPTPHFHSKLLIDGEKSTGPTRKRETSCTCWLRFAALSGAPSPV